MGALVSRCAHLEKCRQAEPGAEEATPSGRGDEVGYLIQDLPCSPPFVSWWLRDRGRHAVPTPHLFLKSPPPAAWANLESIMLSDSGQTQKDKFFMIPLIGGA